MSKLKYDDFEKSQQELSNSIEVNDGFFIFVNEGDYDINLSECETHEKILGWVLQLNDKTWMTPQLMKAFIITACEYNNLPVPKI
mgnify:CR=1 FL=1